MYKSYVPYLQHILDECQYIRSVITDDMVVEQFLMDETLKRAVTLVWDVAKNIIPELTGQIKTVMAANNTPSTNQDV